MADWKIDKKIKSIPFSIDEQVLLHADWMQKKILREFHIAHPGISRIKSLMCSYMYWARVDQDIEKMVKEFRGCQLAAKAPPTKIQPWPKKMFRGRSYTSTTQDL